MESLIGEISATSLTNFMGSLAGGLTTLAFLPQVIRTWRTGSARDLSLLWLITFFCGVLAWVIYGFRLAAVPVIISNLVTLLLVAILLVLKLCRPKA